MMQNFMKTLRGFEKSDKSQMTYSKVHQFSVLV